MSIPDTFEIGKGERKWPKVGLILLLITLSAVSGYGLGKLSKIKESKIPLSVEYSLATTTPILSSENQVEQRKTGKFVASRGGTAYYFPWCSGASRISEKNKIWFETQEEAERLGYKLAKGCK